MGWYYDPSDPAKDDPDFAVPMNRTSGPGGKLKKGSTVKVKPKVSKSKKKKK